MLAGSSCNLVTFMYMEVVCDSAAALAGSEGDGKVMAEDC